ncbi:MAG: hypothetical protein RB146_00905, partial [Armatimonadota bacterium]|nr:hypothetical protein [Armatimonadota bacterium]
MSLSRRGTLTLVPSILVIVALAGAATAQPPAASTAAALTPDDLLAAVDWRTLQELAGGPAWWPDFPQFNVGVGDRAPGLRFYVVQTLVRVAASTPQRLEATALLYADARAARDDFRRRLLEQNDRGADMVQGPSLGAAARYFTRRRTSGDLRAETTLRFVA